MYGELEGQTAQGRFLLSLAFKNHLKDVSLFDSSLHFESDFLILYVDIYPINPNLMVSLHEQISGHCLLNWHISTMEYLSKDLSTTDSPCLSTEYQYFRNILQLLQPHG